MEDVQDGLKVSIQDGVEEDPTVIPMGRGVSGVGKIFIARTLGNPTITTIFNSHKGTGCPDCTITTILGTAVV